MSEYLSDRKRNLNIGIKSYTENQTVLTVIGNVGIGTTNPQAALDVGIGSVYISSGDLHINGTPYIFNTRNGSGGYFFNGGTTGDGYFTNTSPGGKTGFAVKTPSGSAGSFGAPNKNDITYTLSTRHDGTQGISDFKGLVGIGTTNPQAKLHVQGNAIISDIATIGTVNANNANISGITSTGSIYANNANITNNATIGTVDANFANIDRIANIVHLNAQDANVGIATIDTVDANNAIVSGIASIYAISARGSTGNSQEVLTTTVGGELIWQQLSSTTGVTGINVAEDFTSELKYLTMQPGAGTTQITHISSNELVYSSTTKNLGIGTTNPISKLTVQGDVKVSGVVTATTFSGNLLGNATSAGIAAYAIDAGIATYTPNSGIATYTPNAGIATNILGGDKNYIPYQTAVNTTAFIPFGNPGDVLTTDGGNNAPYWLSLSNSTVTGTITIRDEGNIVGTARSISSIDFKGPNIIATADIGGNIATITVADYVSISGYSTYSGIATYANTAGIATYATNSGIATYATDAGISTYATKAGISTYATDAGIATYATNAGIATYTPNAGIATYATDAGIATYATNAGIATYAINAGIATYATNAGIATYAINAGIATYATNAGIATNLNGGIAFQIPYQNSPGITSFIPNGSTGNLLQSNGTNLAPSWASPQGLTIGYADTAGISTYATDAGISTYASKAGIATYANTAGIATYATKAGIATYATDAGISTYATKAGISTYATDAGIATYATNAGIATYTPNAGIATYATNAGIATNLNAGTIYQIPYQSAPNTTAFISTTGVTQGELLQYNIGSAPSWASPQGLIIGYANTAGISTYATDAGISTYATKAGIATYASKAGISTYATDAGIATYATKAGISTYATDAGISTYATDAGISTYATKAGISTYATDAGISTYATKAGIATNLNAGTAYQIPYQSAANTTAFISTSNVTQGQLLQYNIDSAPSWASPQGLIIGYANTAGIATYATKAGIATYATDAGIATYATKAGIATYAPNAGIATYADNAGIATNLNAGTAYQIPYQSASNTTAFISTTGVTQGQLLQYNIDSAPSWKSPQGLTIGYANTAGISSEAVKLKTPRTISLSGDLGGSTSFDGSADVSITATIQPDSVALGNDTTGDYVQSITGTNNQITVSVTSGQGSTPILSIPTQFTAPQDVTVTRDLQVDRNLNVAGNITIGGTTAFINVQQLKVADPDIVLGVRTDAFGNDTSNDTTANHGGIAVASTEGNPLVALYNPTEGEITPATYKKIMWFKAGSFAGLGTDAWLINYAVGIGSTQFPAGTRLAAGNVQFTQNDLAAVRNINSSGIITATKFVGALDNTSALAQNVGFATTASNLAGGSQGSLPYQYSAGITTFLSAAGSNNQVLLYDTGTNKPYWGNVSGASGAFGGITVKDEGTSIGSGITALDIYGSNITATSGGTGIASIRVSDNLVGTSLSISGISTLSSNVHIFGNLGIGTTNPTTKLDVNGDIRLRSGLRDSNDSLGDPNEILVSNGSNVIWTTLGSLGGSDITIQEDSITTTPQYLVFTDVTSGSSYTEKVSPTKLTYIASSGNLGIGTSIPSTPLQVERYGVKTGFGTFVASAGITTDVDNFLISVTNFGTAEYTIHIQSSSSVQAQKVLVMQNGTSAFSQEYAIMYDPTFMVSIGATISGGRCKLQFTPESGISGLMTYRFTRETMI